MRCAYDSNALMSLCVPQVLEEATLVVQMQATNCVVNIAICDDRLPLDPLGAGSTCTVPVVVQTEDGARLAAESAMISLVLKMIAPGGRGKAAQVRARVCCVCSMCCRCVCRNDVYVEVCVDDLGRIRRVLFWGQGIFCCTRQLYTTSVYITSSVSSKATYTS